MMVLIVSKKVIPPVPTFSVKIFKLVGGWATPLKNYEFVNWDDEIPNIWENKKWQPNHQPDIQIYSNFAQYHMNLPT